jgi:hypothetical protein
MPTVISPVSPTPTGLANTSYLTCILLEFGFFFFKKKTCKFFKCVLFYKKVLTLN